LEQLQEQAPCQVKGGPTATAGKVSILLQAHVSQAFVENFALVSDTAYVAQNSARIVRALVEISIWKKIVVLLFFILFLFYFYFIFILFRKNVAICSSAIPKWSFRSVNS